MKRRLKAWAVGSILALGTASGGARGQAGSTTSATGHFSAPAGESVVLRLHGEGVQIYKCEKQGEEPAWIFVSPEATLMDEAGRQVGRHGAGPVWSYQDGSSVHGEVESKAEATDAGSIPWLLLKTVKPEGTGLLSHVSHIARMQTHGGVAPNGGCDAAHLGAIARMDYTATYVFYRKP